MKPFANFKKENDPLKVKGQIKTGLDYGYYVD